MLVEVRGSTPIPLDRLEHFLKPPENNADLFRFIDQEMVNDLITFPKYYIIFQQG